MVLEVTGRGAKVSIDTPCVIHCHVHYREVFTVVNGIESTVRVIRRRSGSSRRHIQRRTQIDFIHGTFFRLGALKVESALRYTQPPYSRFWATDVGLMPFTTL